MSLLKITKYPFTLEPLAGLQFNVVELVAAIILYRSKYKYLATDM
jgi:hypothetical protein